MKFRENERKSFDFKAKALIILSILISFFAIMLPIWQKGLSRQTHYEFLLSKQKLEKLDEEERNLLAYISSKEETSEVASTNLKAGI